MIVLLNILFFLWKKETTGIKKKCVYGICVLCVILLDGISPPPPHVVSGQSHIVHTARPNRVLPFGQKAPNIITTPIKNRPEDLFFKLLRTMRQWGPAHGQCSDLCLSKLWDNCVTYYKETVPVRDRGGVGVLSQNLLGGSQELTWLGLGVKLIIY